MDEKLKEEISNMSYEQLFRLWRFEPPGSRYFSGEIGSYFCEIFKKKRVEVGDEYHTQISKMIGW